MTDAAMASPPPVTGERIKVFAVISVAANAIGIIIEANNLNSKIITTEKDYLRLENTSSERINFIQSELRIIDEHKLIETIFKENEIH